MNDLISKRDRKLVLKFENRKARRLVHDNIAIAVYLVGLIHQFPSPLELGRRCSLGGRAQPCRPSGRRRLCSCPSFIDSLPLRRPDNRRNPSFLLRLRCGDAGKYAFAGPPARGQVLFLRIPLPLLIFHGHRIGRSESVREQGMRVLEDIEPRIVNGVTIGHGRHLAGYHSRRCSLYTRRGRGDVDPRLRPREV